VWMMRGGAFWRTGGAVGVGVGSSKTTFGKKKTSDSWKSPSLCPPETYLTPLYAARSSIAVPPFFGMWMNNGPLYWSLYGTVDGPRPR
jgi:hypothetical protein